MTFTLNCFVPSVTSSKLGQNLFLKKAFKNRNVRNCLIIKLVYGDIKGFADQCLPNVILYNAILQKVFLKNQCNEYVTKSLSKSSYNTDLFIDISFYLTVLYFIFLKFCKHFYRCHYSITLF